MRSSGKRGRSVAETHEKRGEDEDEDQRATLRRSDRREKGLGESQG